MLHHYFYGSSEILGARDTWWTLLSQTSSACVRVCVRVCVYVFVRTNVIWSLRMVLFCGMWRLVVRKYFTDVSEEYILVLPDCSTSKNKPSNQPARIKQQAEQYISPKRRRTSAWLPVVTSQKIILFIFSAVRPSNPARWSPVSWHSYQIF
jgi:hypothetical protein